MDKVVNFYLVTDPMKWMGTIILRHMLYKYFKMPDGHCLFEEVHQAAPMGAVDVAIPNCKEVKRMMLMIQKNSAAYFTIWIWTMI